MKMNKGILMLCYFFPPLADVGCRRSIGFAKYLGKYGWEPQVLSVSNPDRQYCVMGKESPPAGVAVDYCRSLINLYGLVGKIDCLLVRMAGLLGLKMREKFLFDLVCIPDHFIGWMPLSIMRGLSIIRRKNIEVIYVSCTPFSAAISGVILKVLTKKKLVLDFRDPFALRTSSFNRKSAFKKATRSMIERFLFNHADLLLVTSSDVEREYLKQYPDMAGRISLIRNGFDSAYLEPGDHGKFQRFTICYTGQFYLHDPEQRKSSQQFFRAMQYLKQTSAINPGSFRFLYYGDSKAGVAALAKEYGVEELVSLHGRIPYPEVLKVIRGSHYQLIKLKKYMMSTKLYEGIPLNVPYLATIRCDEAEEIIVKYSPSSVIVSGEAYEEIAAGLETAMARVREGKVRDNLVGEFLRDFSRERQTERFADLLNSKFQPAAADFRKGSLNIGVS
jgi:glycosyltransferase involved in cell wall biosynthesis